MSDVRRVVNGKTNTNQHIDRGHTTDGHIPEIHVAQSVHNGQHHTEHHPDGDARVGHQRKDHHQNHRAADGQVLDQFFVNDADLFPVEEVEAVREGTRIKCADLAPHGSHGVVAISATIGGCQGKLRVETRRLQPLRQRASCRDRICVAIQVTGLAGPQNGATVPGSHGGTIPSVQRRVKLRLLAEDSVAVRARRRKGVVRSGGLVGLRGPLHELRIPTVHCHIVVDQL
mmetsp:Transcript_3338/g.5660  ORF Transcript_3338/g.5660 Transcript_3338/m.5660 type:complete len:229 (-) Transcript_3338:1295-1981(-)